MEEETAGKSSAPHDQSPEEALTMDLQAHVVIPSKHIDVIA